MRKNVNGKVVKVSKEVKAAKKATVKYPLQATIPVYQMGGDEPELIDEVEIKVEKEDNLDDTSTAVKLLYRAFPIAEQDTEFNYLVTFDGEHHPLGVYVSPEGEDAAELSYEDIFLAIKRDNAKNVITAHNHPYEPAPLPSDGDIRAFKDRRGVLKARLSDDLLLGSNSDCAYSLKESGFFEVDDAMAKLYSTRLEEQINEIYSILVTKLCNLECKFNKIMERMGISED